jgi:alpha-glucosidase
VLNIEGLKGLENCKWSKLITPTHDTLLPYTRMVAGPLDYTPGAMRNLPPESFQISNSSPASMGTRCHELAKYVIFDAPLQMLCDAPPHYRREEKTMEFLREVPAVWDKSIALDGRIGEFAVMARRSGERWFVGAMTNEQARELKLDISQLGAGPWQVRTWSDLASSATKATEFSLTTGTLVPGIPWRVSLAPSGGFVAILSR